jgi:hypothetical protein
VTYTIKGEEWTKFDINKRCAEILAWVSERNVKSVTYGNGVWWVNSVGCTGFKIKDYCNSPADCWPIIEKCWEELNESTLKNGGRRKSYWQEIMNTHNCTKLVAACICLVELNSEGVN